MGGGNTTCPLDVSNNSSPINRRNPLFNDVWAEAVIPLETSFTTLRTNAFTSDGNNELLEKSLDLIEERKENATVQLAYYQHKLKQSYDTNVKLKVVVPRRFGIEKRFRNYKESILGKIKA